MTTPHGLDEIISDVRGHPRICRGGWATGGALAAGFPGAREFAVSAPPVVGPLTNHHPDDMPPAH